jgi:hypothetical protein
MSDQPQKKRVAISLTGDSFTANFTQSLVRSLYALWNSGRYEVVMCFGQSSMVHFARMRSLGLSTTRGRDQKIFNDMPVDVVVMIDSDIVFSPEQLMQLIDATDIHPVVCGLYRMADLQHFACCTKWDTAYFAEHGTFEMETPQSIQAWRENTQLRFASCVYTGLGFFAARKSVWDALQYPYFHADLEVIEGKDGVVIQDLLGEDTCLCRNIIKAGFNIMMDCTLIVGHEKRIVI